MNNQWRDNARCMVVWADGTYDARRSCDECGSETCKRAIHTDRYKEIGTTNTEEIGENSGVGYWDFMHSNQPLGGKFDFDGELWVKEFFTANPDGLLESEGRSSGITEEQQEMLEAAFEQLTDKQKEAWQLVMRDQVSQVEAARRMNIVQPAVFKHLQLAKVKITNYLRDHVSA